MADTFEVAGFVVYRLRAPLARRMARLLPGLFLFGTALALTVEAGFGTNPWTVFHQGAAQRLGLSIGTVVTGTGLLLVLLFRRLREPLGFGTVANAVGVGVSMDVVLWLVPDIQATWLRATALIVAPPLLGLASGLYIGAGLGPGPRDGLMTAFGRRGMTISMARTVIELTALAVGWLLGGVVGIGTVYFGVTVGWFVGLFLDRFRIDDDRVGV
ncbi:MAG: YczE/YyaS/YitT family protein [Acidimicrobiales bacterium]